MSTITTTTTVGEFVGQRVTDMLNLLGHDHPSDTAARRNVRAAQRHAVILFASMLTGDDVYAADADTLIADCPLPSRVDIVA